MTRRGTGLVFLHHALASWPAWEGYAELVGGRYHFWPGTLRGTDRPDSGYLHDAEHRVTVLAPDHPVSRGVDAAFSLRDATRRGIASCSPPSGAGSVAPVSTARSRGWRPTAPTGSPATTTARWHCAVR